LTYSFGSFGLWSVGSIALGPVVKYHIIVGVNGRKGCSPHDGQEVGVWFWGVKGKTPVT
jgi:hypothetical protein